MVSAMDSIPRRSSEHTIDGLSEDVSGGLFAQRWRWSVVIVHANDRSGCIAVLKEDSWLETGWLRGCCFAVGFSEAVDADLGGTGSFGVLVIFNSFFWATTQVAQ